MGEPKEILALALDPPDLRNIKSTVMQLKDLGALLATSKSEGGRREFKEDDGDITVLGELVASMPIDIRLGKLVVFGHLFNCLEECVIIAAGLSNKSIFAFPLGQRYDFLFWMIYLSLISRYVYPF